MKKLMAILVTVAMVATLAVGASASETTVPSSVDVEMLTFAFNEEGTEITLTLKTAITRPAAFGSALEVVFGEGIDMTAEAKADLSEYFGASVTGDAAPVEGNAKAWALPLARFQSGTGEWAVGTKFLTLPVTGEGTVTIKGTAGAASGASAADAPAVEIDIAISNVKAVTTPATTADETPDETPDETTTGGGVKTAVTLMVVPVIAAAGAALVVSRRKRK